MPDNLTALDYAEWCDDMAERWPDWADRFAPIARLLRETVPMPDADERVSDERLAELIRGWQVRVKLDQVLREMEHSYNAAAAAPQTAGALAAPATALDQHAPGRARLDVAKRR